LSERVKKQGPVTLADLCWAQLSLVILLVGATGENIHQKAGC